MPDYIFLGDDTGAADAKVEIENIALPEPTAAALGLGIVGLCLRARPKRR